MSFKLIIAIVVGLVLLGGLYYYYDYRNRAPSQTGSANQETQSKSDQTPVIPSNLKIETLTQGQGPGAKNGDTISVNYTGSLTNGTVFDSSIPRGQPFSFTIGQGRVIQGWELGLLGMKVGEKRKLTIPPELGYGPQGTPGGPIPPNATLIFEVELLKINN